MSNPILDILTSIHPVVGLSPMDGLTDEPFRLLQSKIAKPDIIFTEFVSAEGLSHNATKLFDHLLYSQIERPIIGQIFGRSPDSFYSAGLMLCYLGFDGIDINMGCPAATVTQHGGGAALIDKPAVAAELIKAVKAAINDFSTQSRTLTDLHLKQKTLDTLDHNNVYSGFKIDPKNIQPPTLSVKTRLGTNEPVIERWIPYLGEQPLDFITLHGRTLKQGYSGVSDWELIKESARIIHQTKLKIIGSGDIKNRHQGSEYSQKYGVDGYLIGRGCLGNPWVFLQETTEITSQQKFDTLLLHAQMARSLFPDRQFDYLRQQFLLYAAGLPNAKKMRTELVRVSSLDQLCALEQEFVSC